MRAHLPQNVLNDVVKVRVDHEREGLVLCLKHKLVDVKVQLLCISTLQAARWDAQLEECFEGSKHTTLALHM